MKEIWKDIPWYEWYYQASNLWNIKSLTRIDVINNRWWWKNIRKKKEKIIKPYNNGKWYMYVDLCINYKSKRKYVHILVANTFIENPKATVNHKNWIRHDNRLENLEWATYSENHLHKFNVLWYRLPKRRKHKQSKKVNQYTKNWKFIKTWHCIKEIEDKLNIFATSVSACCKWKLKTSWWYIWKYVHNN